MAPIDKTLLVNRLRNYRYLDDLLNDQELKNGGITRSDLWRRIYYNDPYLAVISQEAMIDRFQDVFLNLHRLSDEGKISIVDPLEEADKWFSKWTEVLEETNSRGLLTQKVMMQAREPILKYFENDPPRGVKLFREYPRPKSPYYVKIGKHEHLSKMFKEGSVRLTPASFYSGASLNDAIRDDELKKTFFLPSLLPYLMGQKYIDLPVGHFEMKDAEWPIDVSCTNDYLMFCVSGSIENRLLDDFDGDSALIIKDVSKFILAIKKGLSKLKGKWAYRFDSVTYFDPYRDHKKVTKPEFLKHFRYTYQKESRFVAINLNHTTGNLQPEFINIGGMKDYADFLSLR